MQQKAVYLLFYTCILPSKTQHMYINALMKYQLHRCLDILMLCFRP